MSTHCLLQEYGFLLKKHPILKTDCNLQAAFSFNNNNFLFQWMLQCAVTDRWKKKHDWTCCFGRFLGWWMNIYIHIYICISIILKSCYDDIAQSMLFCLCTTGLFFFFKAAISSCRPQVALRLLDALAVRTDGFYRAKPGRSAKFVRSFWHLNRTWIFLSKRDLNLNHIVCFSNDWTTHVLSTSI